MKRLLLTLLTALALPTAVEANWFGKYNSKAQAWEACQQWKNGQKIYYSDYAIKTKRYSKLLREVKDIHFEQKNQSDYNKKYNYYFPFD